MFSQPRAVLSPEVRDSDVKAPPLRPHAGPKHTSLSCSDLQVLLAEYRKEMLGVPLLQVARAYRVAIDYIIDNRSSPGYGNFGLTAAKGRVEILRGILSRQFLMLASNLCDRDSGLAKEVLIKIGKQENGKLAWWQVKTRINNMLWEANVRNADPIWLRDQFEKFAQLKGAQRGSPRFLAQSAWLASIILEEWHAHHSA